MLDVLIIAPHPDDAEIAMGGSIVRMHRDGLRVGILDLTNGEPTPHGDPVTRKLETDAATEVLGITWRENLGWTNRELQATLSARSALAEVMRRVRPRWLFAPYWIDAHPDHVVASALVDDARFWSKLTKSHMLHEPFHPRKVFYYFSLHLRLAVQPSFVVDISDVFPQKLDALRCYHSQFIAGHESEVPSPLERIQTHCAYFGNLIGTTFGEPFACRELPGLSGFRELI
jgi:bacillithiol biosynthesis deacetylase BshB1